MKIHLGRKSFALKLFILTIMTAALVACRPSNDGEEGNQRMDAGSEPALLELGHPILRNLAGGETHTFHLRLEAGQYVRLAAEQRGVDLKLRLYAPDAHLIEEVDSPSGERGTEVASEVAQLAGDYRVEVLSDNPSAKPGQYELRVEELRPATEQDRTRVKAERTFQEGEALRRDKEWERAEASYQQALTLHRSVGDRAGEGTDLYRIGSMQERRGERRHAIELFNQARAIFLEVGDRYSEGVVLNARGRVQYDLGDAAGAVASHLEALEIFRGESDPKAEASTLNNLGNAYALTGKTGLAITAYQDAQTLWRRLENQKLALQTSYNVGALFLDLDKRPEARDAFESALREARSLQNDAITADALYSLGDLDQREERFPEARAHLQSALELQDKIQDTRGRAITDVTLATVLIKQGELEPARIVGERALETFRGIGDRRGEGIALAANLGRYHLAKGELPQALARMREALSIFEATGDRQGIALARHASGQALAGMGDLEGARRELEQALDTVEGLRTESSSLDFRASYFASRQEYWDTYIDVLLRMHEGNPQGGFDALALQAAERRRARSLLDALAQAPGDVENGADPQIRTEIQAVQQAINSTDQKRLDIATQEDSEDGLREIERRQRALLVRLDSLRTEMRNRSPRFADLTDPKPLNPELIRGALGSRTLLLVYSLGETRSALWAVSEKQITSHFLEKRSKLEALARQVYELLPQHSPSAQEKRRQKAEILSQLLLGPVQGDLHKYKRILIVADGALQWIPFATLPEPGSQPQRLLVEGYEIVHLPSVSVLSTLRRKSQGRAPAEKLRVAVIADPVFRADDPRVQGRETGGPSPLPPDLVRSTRSIGLDGLKRLPYTRDEAKAIRELVEKKKGAAFEALDFAAVRELMNEDRVRKAHVLHLATHSLMDPRQPELSGIVFSLVDEQGRPRDGFLRLHEIYNLSLDTDLVVLSACQTGVGKELRGEGLMGITRGFMYAGAPRVVVSLWSVDDRSTAELMKRFYHYLLEMGQPPAEALRSAQISMLREPEWSDPWHWGGFIYQGDYQGRPGGVEEQDTGGTGSAKKANSDMPPPDVPPDKPPVRKPRPPQGSEHE